MFSLFLVGARFGWLGGSLLLPSFVTLARVYLHRFQALFKRKHPGAFADEHNVARFLHDPAGSRNRVPDAFKTCDAAGLVSGTERDAGIQLHHSGCVRTAAQADRAIT